MKRIITATALVLVAATLLSPAYGTSIVDLEYSSGIGVGYYYVTKGSFGGYINGFVGNEVWDSHGEHYDNISYDTAKYFYGDPLIEEYKESYFINAGLTRGLTDNFGLYAGVGLGWSQKSAEFYDPTHILSANGHYNVDRGDGDLEFNFNGGVLLHMHHVSLNLGYNSINESVAFGIGYAW